MLQKFFFYRSCLACSSISHDSRLFIFFSLIGSLFFRILWNFSFRICVSRFIWSFTICVHILMISKTLLKSSSEIHNGHHNLISHSDKKLNFEKIMFRSEIKQIARWPSGSRTLLYSTQIDSTNELFESPAFLHSCSSSLISFFF